MNYCRGFDLLKTQGIIFFACVFAFKVPLEILLFLLLGMDGELEIQGFLILFLFRMNRNLFSVLDLVLFFRLVVVLFSFLLLVILLLFVILLDFLLFV